MPIYEYRCGGCRRRVSLLRKLNDPQPPACPHCGSRELARLFSSFSLRRSDKATYEDILSDSQLIKRLEQNDPRALAEWNRRLSGGEPVAPEYEEMMHKLEQGEMPQEGGQ